MMITIDRTNGKAAKYLVLFYGWRGHYKYICSNMAEAKEIFGDLTRKQRRSGTAVSIYDLDADVRKAYHKY